MGRVRLLLAEQMPRGKEHMMTFETRMMPAREES